MRRHDEIRLRHMLEAASLFATPSLFDSRIYSYGSFHRVTGTESAVSVPYGTETECYQRCMDALVRGPGNVDQAHTVGEWIAVEQLHEAVEVYSRLSDELCGL